VTEQPRAQLHIDPVGGVREDIGAQAGKQAFEYRDACQPDYDHIERRQALMHQHLVDHHLEEKRRDEREKLQKKRSGQHFAQQLAVFDHRLKEPTDVEAAADIGQMGAAGHQDQLSAPLPGERSALHQRGFSRRRIERQRFIVHDLAEDEKASVPAQRNRRKRRAGKPFPVAFHQTRLQPQFLCAAQYLQDADLLPVTMGNLACIGGDAVMPQHQRQDGDAAGNGGSGGYIGHRCHGSEEGGREGRGGEESRQEAGLRPKPAQRSASSS
jgi:hypothetical protein